MAKYIPLADWAALHFAPPPAIRTLRQWVKNRRISPEPVLIGREYRVLEDATYVPPVTPLRIPPITVLESEDSVVNEIFASGKAAQRRTA